LLQGTREVDRYQKKNLSQLKLDIVFRTEERKWGVRKAGPSKNGQGNKNHKEQLQEKSCGEKFDGEKIRF